MHMQAKEVLQELDVFGAVFLNFQIYLIYQADCDKAVSKRLASVAGDFTFHDESGGFFYLRYTN